MINKFKSLIVQLSQPGLNGILLAFLVEVLFKLTHVLVELRVELPELSCFKQRCVFLFIDIGLTVFKGQSIQVPREFFHFVAFHVECGVDSVDLISLGGKFTQHLVNLVGFGLVVMPESRSKRQAFDH